ncbi:hypothetical protein [Rhizobium sp. CC-YZS058]|uniref:hypothetical protein n=1 Tax=Rhizobium sp. CC-YZS058 TaxID=3042153 RepID=UPI002B0588E9|nr:hypothetical protein [Rhizobium sp. CC-YZS058]MEA3533160.1 hypothetical protein [Rhizobium sp. CC-YZS058]
MTMVDCMAVPDWRSAEPASRSGPARSACAWAQTVTLRVIAQEKKRHRPFVFADKIIRRLIKNTVGGDGWVLEGQGSTIGFNLCALRTGK